MFGLKVIPVSVLSPIAVSSFSSGIARHLTWECGSIGEMHQAISPIRENLFLSGTNQLWLGGANAPYKNPDQSI